MVEKTMAIYVFLDDIFKFSGHKEPENRRVSDAEVITTVLIAGMYFGGNFERALSFVRGTGLIPNMLGKSRFNRRVHGASYLMVETFRQLATTIKRLNIESEYAMDSFPVRVCDNIRIKRSKLVRGLEYRGYKPSKREYFYGFTVQVIATVDGIPVEFAITPGHMHDSEGMRHLCFDLPEGSRVYADSGYTDYLHEDDLYEALGIKLLTARKSNSKRKREPWEEFLVSHYRKGIEVVFSDINKLFPRRIHAITPEGFILKIIMFILAYVFTKIN